MPATTLIDRALLRISGEDVRDFLQGLVTNDVSQLAEDNPLWAGLLTAQGKALFDFILWADGEDVLVDCERNAAGDLAKRLTLYRLRRPIQIGRDRTRVVEGKSVAVRVDHGGRRITKKKKEKYNHNKEQRKQNK